MKSKMRLKIFCGIVAVTLLIIIIEIAIIKQGEHYSNIIGVSREEKKSEKMENNSINVANEEKLDSGINKEQELPVSQEAHSSNENEIKETEKWSEGSDKFDNQVGENVKNRENKEETSIKTNTDVELPFVPVE